MKTASYRVFIISLLTASLGACTLFDMRKVERVDNPAATAKQAPPAAN